MLRSLLAAVLLLAVSAEAKAPPAAAVIYYSSAPWDGAAYEMRVPLKRTKSEAKPTLRIFIWDRPPLEAGLELRFTSHEDSGGGPGKGQGTASFQTVLDKTMPKALSGTLTFAASKPGGPLSGAYDLQDAAGRAFRGTFKATWGNKPSDARGG